MIVTLILEASCIVLMRTVQVHSTRTCSGVPRDDIASAMDAKVTNRRIKDELVITNIGAPGAIFPVADKFHPAKTSSNTFKQRSRAKKIVRMTRKAFCIGLMGSLRNAQVGS